LKVARYGNFADELALGAIGFGNYAGSVVLLSWLFLLVGFFQSKNVGFSTD
jgi:hypothetical protein